MPVAAMEEAAEGLASLQGAVLSVHPRQCLNLRHQRAGCTACSEVCPTQAIRWSPRFRAEPFDCAECGACASACPSGALEERGETALQRLARISRAVSETGRVLLACPLHLRRDRSLRRRADIVEVPCIGGLEPWVLVAAVSFGATSVLLLDARCSRCTHKAAHKSARRAVDGAKALLAAWGREEEVRLTGEEPPVPEGKGRRGGLAGVLSRRGPKATEELAQRDLDLALFQDAERHEDGGRRLPVRLPRAHRLLLHFLPRLGQPRAEELPPGSPLGRVEIGDACSGCGMCAYFCPTGALRKREDAGVTEILFQPQACTACGLCTRLCYQGAIRLGGARPAAVLAGQEEVLWSGRPATPEERLREATRRLV